MIGFTLLIIAILSYITKYKKYSILIYLLFMSQGLRVLTDDILGVKNLDLAFIYTLIICTYSYFFEKGSYEEDKILKSLVLYFTVFLVCSILFSRFHYGFTWYQILQGCRHHFLFLSYFFLRKCKTNDIIWVFRILFYFTFFHAILYIIQVLTELPVLPYGENKIDESTGIARYYNYPVFLQLYLLLSILYPCFYQSSITKYTPFVLFAALFCTLGRTFITLNILCVLLGLLLKGQSKKLIKKLIVFGIILIPFINIIATRFESGGETNNDIEEIISGKFIERLRTGEMGGGTMSYRFAWVYERAQYLSERPLSENIFGMGMISDSQSNVVLKKYNFILGLINDETGLPAQLYTPDIAYGNLLTQFGYVGGFILLLIWIRLFVILFKGRKYSPLIFCMSLLLFNYIIGSLSGSTISTTGNLIAPFTAITILFRLKRQDTL